MSELRAHEGGQCSKITSNANSIRFVRNNNEIIVEEEIITHQIFKISNQVSRTAAVGDSGRKSHNAKREIT